MEIGYQCWARYTAIWIELLPHSLGLDKLSPCTWHTHIHTYTNTHRWVYIRHTHTHSRTVWGYLNKCLWVQCVCAAVGLRFITLMAAIFAELSFHFHLLYSYLIHLSAGVPKLATWVGKRHRRRRRRRQKSNLRANYDKLKLCCWWHCTSICVNRI